MLQPKNKVASSTFESGDISNTVAKLTGLIDGKEIDHLFTGAEDKEKTPCACIKAFFSDGNSDTFISAVMFAEKVLFLHKTGKDGKRIPLTIEEVESLRFSYTQDKDTGQDISPEVSWEQIVAKFESCQPFSMVQLAPRKARTGNSKEIALAY